jgi:hypothetical protein
MSESTGREQSETARQIKSGKAAVQVYQTQQKAKRRYTNRTANITTAVQRRCDAQLTCSQQPRSTLFHPIASISFLVLRSHRCLGLPNSVFTSGFPNKTLHALLFSPVRSTCPVHLNLSSTAVVCCSYELHCNCQLRP